MIELLTRKEFAEKHHISEEAVRVACQKGTLSKVEFSWKKEGKTYKGKFILPKDFVIVSRAKLLEATRGVSL